ncbi:MAG: hypothetical protein ABIK28_13075 [Planctomycetota bacterium]
MNENNALSSGKAKDSQPVLSHRIMSHSLGLDSYSLVADLDSLTILSVLKVR